MPQAPALLLHPPSPGMHRPRVHICCTLQGWEKLGSMKHPRLIKTHQLSLRCTRRRTPHQCQKSLPGQWDHRHPTAGGDGFGATVRQLPVRESGMWVQTAGIWPSPALPHVLPELAAVTPPKAPAPAEPLRGDRELCQPLTAGQQLNSGTPRFLLQTPELMKHHNFQHAGSNGAGGPTGMWQPPNSAGDTKIPHPRADRNGPAPSPAAGSHQFGAFGFQTHAA